MTNSTRYHIRLKKPGMVLQCNISIFFYVRIAKVNFVTYLLVRSLEFLVNDDLKRWLLVIKFPLSIVQGFK